MGRHEWGHSQLKWEFINTVSFHHNHLPTPTYHGTWNVTTPFNLNRYHLALSSKEPSSTDVSTQRIRDPICHQLAYLDFPLTHKEHHVSSWFMAQLHVVDLLRPSDSYMRLQSNHHCSRLKLAAWSAPSHDLNQYWNIVNSNIRNQPQWNPKGDSYIFIQDNAFANDVWKMAAILSRPHELRSGVAWWEVE